MRDRGEQPKDETIEGDSREPYEAPSFECEELFEVLALACGKLAGSGGFCRGRPHNS